jgi:hypothetical protein
MRDALVGRKEGRVSILVKKKKERWGGFEFLVAIALHRNLAMKLGTSSGLSNSAKGVC